MPDIAFDALAAVARKHGLPSLPEPSVPWRGATSVVVPWHDAVIKVPHDRPDALHALAVDAAMNGVLRTQGVAVPALRAYDESRDIVDVPVAIFERVRHAVPLSTIGVTSPAAQSAWSATGEVLAAIHRISPEIPVPIPLRSFRQTPEIDPRTWLEALAERGAIVPDAAAWLRRLLDVLAPVAVDHESPTLCHGDVNAANVLVDAVTGEFRAIIDLAGMGWLDPVWDFVAVPLAVVPWMLAGHRSVAPLPHDESAEHRICWCQIQTRLHTAFTKSDDELVRQSLVDDLRQVRAFVDRHCQEFGHP